jgi:uncharacterized phiE125 gp8 family phage protein
MKHSPTQVQQLVTAPAAEPVTTAELKAQLRLNDSSEDSLLAGYIKSAREYFENLTHLSVRETAWKQWSTYLNNPVPLLMGNVRAISAVKYYNTSDVLTTTTDYSSDIIGTPALVWFESPPAVKENRKFIMSIEYTAGWDSDKVPQLVKDFVLIVAAYKYSVREAFSETNWNEIPLGARNIASQYMTGYSYRGEDYGRCW